MFAAWEIYWLLKERQAPTPPLETYHCGGVFESEFLASNAGTGANGARTESSNGRLPESLRHFDFCGGPPVRRLLGLGRRYLVELSTFKQQEAEGSVFEEKRQEVKLHLPPPGRFLCCGTAIGTDVAVVVRAYGSWIVMERVCGSVIWTLWFVSGS
ncbi:hypothetical protein MTO96_031189 [Rhipicephalus appendiculatus]